MWILYMTIHSSYSMQIIHYNFNCLTFIDLTEETSAPLLLVKKIINLGNSLLNLIEYGFNCQYLLKFDLVHFIFKPQLIKQFYSWKVEIFPIILLNLFLLPLWEIYFYVFCSLSLDHKLCKWTNLIDSCRKHTFMFFCSLEIVARPSTHLVCQIYWDLIELSNSPKIHKKKYSLDM